MTGRTRLLPPAGGRAGPAARLPACLGGPLERNIATWLCRVLLAGWRCSRLPDEAGVGLGFLAVENGNKLKKSVPGGLTPSVRLLSSQGIARLKMVVVDIFFFSLCVLA